MLMKSVSTLALCAALYSGQAMAQTVAPVVPPPTADENARQIGAEQGAAPGTPAQSSAAVAAQDDTNGVGDIVVTAQRRSENLQRVPISVTAVTAASLATSGAGNISSITTVVPGLVVQRTYAGVNPFLRGIGSITSGFTAEQPVAIYIDGVYVPNAASGLFGFNNIERVEVLKGPQGTLFGRNAVGGLVNVVTRDPSQDTHVEGGVGYGNYQTVDANLYAATGVTENLAADFSMLYTDQGKGWGTNTYTGDNIFKQHEVSLGSKIVWRPTSDTKVTLRGLFDHTRSDIGIGFGVFPGSIAIDGEKYISEYTIANQFDPNNHSSQINGGLTIEQGLGAVKLVSTTGYNYITDDFTGTSNGILGQAVNGRSAVYLHNFGGSHTFTQEIQLLSQNNTKIDWIVGGFFLHDHIDLFGDVFPSCFNGVCAPNPQAIRSHAEQLLNSYSGFGELTLHIGDATRLTGGLRYTHEDKDDSGGYRVPLPGYGAATPATLASPNFFGDVGGAAPTASYSKVTYRAVLAHDFTPDVMAYASVNRGFKAGSFNLTAFANPVAQPEVLDAYEIGLKSTLFDHMLRLNLSGFYYDYKNIQLRTLAPPAPPGLAILYNAAEAHIKGIDADIVIAPSRHFTITGGAEFLDPRFTSFPGGTCTTPRVVTATVLGGAASTPCDLSGYRLARAAKFTGNISATYRIPSPVGEFSLNANDYYNGGFFWDVDNRLRQAAYHRVNLTLGWTAPDEKFNAQLYVHNLNKPYYLLGVTTASGGTDDYTPGEPRTYGAKVGFKF